MRSMLCAALVTFAASGCESSYVYRPESHAQARIQGRQAAEYPLPTPATPQGSIRIASYGVSKVTPQANDHGTMHALHVREVVDNESNRPWTIDTRAQAIELRDGQRIGAAYVRSDANTLPIVTVPPAGKRTLDLLFPLPASEEKASHIPEFDVIWRVDAGGVEVAQRTPFQRLRVEPYYASVGWGYPYDGAFAWGPYGWMDPLWGPGVIAAPGWYW
jgi:hypothetical protein